MSNSEIVSYGGHELGTDYSGWLLGGDRISLPAVDAALLPRVGAWPALGAVGRPGRRLAAAITIDGADTGALRAQLMRWFDPEDEAPKALVLAADGARAPQRYVMAICEALQPMAKGDRVVPGWYVATLAVVGDVRWRSVVARSATWSVTADGDKETISNGGDDEAYPVLAIEATAVGVPYRRWVPIVWRAAAGASRYPVQIAGLNTADLVTAGKVQPDGSDLRVESDGVEVDRWLDRMNTSNTRVWINLDFDAAVSMTLAAAIAAAGDIDSITMNEAITDLPAQGILRIESEVFVYTVKTDGTKTFSGITRAARGTSEAGHAEDTAVQWIQHDVYLYYGGASAQAADDDYKPAFTLSQSNNGSWDYDEFGADDGLRAGGWVQEVVAGAATFYGGNQGAAADPWVELGMAATTDADQGRVYLYNPCYIVGMYFQNGERYFETSAAGWQCCLQRALSAGAWSDDSSVAAPASAGLWDAWSQWSSVAFEMANHPYGGLWLSHTAAGGANFHVEAADCKVTLHEDYIPAVSLGPELATPRVLAGTITNNTTGEAIAVAYTLESGEELEIDTDRKTVTDLSAGTRQLQALTIDGPRRQWLPLAAGDNELEWTETAVAETTVTVEFEERWYS